MIALQLERVTSKQIGSRCKLTSTPGCRPVVIVRLCGRTPTSDNVLTLLQSVCQQICYNFNISLDSVPTDLAPTVIFLQDIMKNATKEHPILIFLDSIDEVGIF